MRIIIAGGRDFKDFDNLCRACDYYLQNKEKDSIEIISGCARGADTLGEKYAKIHNYKLTKFPAKWNIHHRRAGFIRNEEMAEYADALIVFWDGMSKGTKHMIDTAIKYGLELRILKY